ncbi:type IV secretory system conjugative DNA transfer family protein [Ralstonia nicotianae]
MNNKKKKIYWGRLRNQDDGLNATDTRTYFSDHVIMGSIVFIATCFVMHLVMTWTQGIGLDWSITHLYSHDENQKELARDKVIGTMIFGLISGFFLSFKLVQKVTWSAIAKETKDLFYEDSTIANYEFHKIQHDQDNTLYKTGTALIKVEDTKKEIDLKFFKLKVKKGKNFLPITINSNASILSKLVIGMAGSGKSVMLDWLYEAELEKGTKLIIHSPDQKARNMIANSGYTYAISAPWYKDSIYIDIFKTLDVEDINQQNALIDVIITSIYGYVDQSSDNAFFENGAVYILTASLRKIIDVARQEKRLSSLDDWINELVSKNQIYQFKELVDVYYPEAGFTISEDAEKMTASIIASITRSLTSIGLLNNFYKQNRKAFDLRKWCLDIPELDPKGQPLNEKQVIVLCGDKEYSEVSKINIALFINMASVFLLSSEREATFNKNKVRVHQILDEFPNFAKNIEMNKWIEIINEGRKFGNIATIACQNTHQITSCLKGSKVDSQKFLGSFHSQIICQPSPEDGEFIENVCGEVTYIDQEANPTYDTSTGKKSISWTKKPRTEKVTWKKLQENLGIVNIKVSKNENEKIGVNVAFRLVGTNLTAILFFPFNTSFCHRKRQAMLSSGKIIKEGNLEKFTYKDKFGRKVIQPLFFKERKIQFTEAEQAEIYRMRTIEAKSNLLAKLVDRKDLAGAEKIRKELEELKSKNPIKIIEKDSSSPVKEEQKEAPAEGFSEATSEVLKHGVLHGIDHTGTLGMLDTALDILDEMTSKEEDSTPSKTIIVNNDVEEPKKKKIRIKKEIER